MPFNSLMFLYFFPIVAITYYLIPYRYRWIFLLAASGYFYAMFSTTYLLLILFIILFNYFSAIAIEKTSARDRKVILVVSILIYVAILGAFKYSSMVSQVFLSISALSKLEYYLILPIGLSYITLQSISYAVDIYNDRQTAEKNIGFLALFFLFFPKIMAGPVERPINLIPQFRKNHSFDYTAITNGLKFMAWGFLKKIIIADNLALSINPIFQNPHEYPAVSLLFATVAFALQIYFDFSGYSDIALGSAQVIGINLTNNFKNPYFASSVSEFWQRWHISLSLWLRDYIFFPLRRYIIKNRKNQTLSIIAASMVTMLVSGFWHGTGITFIVWGLLHGLFITIPPLMNNLQKNKSNDRLIRWEKTMKPAQVVLTVFLVSFSWIFFRANSLSDAFYIISNIFNNVPVGQGAALLASLTIRSHLQLSILPVFIIAAFRIEYLREKYDFLENLSHKSPLVRWTLYIMAITSLIVFGAHGFSEVSHFIYFQF